MQLRDSAELEAFMASPDHDTFAGLTHTEKRFFVAQALKRFPRHAYLVEVLTNEESDRSYCLFALTDAEHGEVLEYATALIAFPLSGDFKFTLDRKCYLDQTHYGLRHLTAGASDLGWRATS